MRSAVSGKRLEHREPRRQLADRLQVGGARHRPLAGPLPVPDGLRRVPGLGEVVGQQLRLGRHHLGKPRFEHLRDPLVDLLPGAPEQRRVGRVLDQRMLEHIPGPRRPSPLVEELGGHQLSQPRLQGRARPAGQ